MCSSFDVIQPAAAVTAVLSLSQTINGPTKTAITMWPYWHWSHTARKNHNSYATAATYIAGPGFESQPQVLQPYNYVGHDSMLPDKYNLAVEIRYWPSKAQWLLYVPPLEQSTILRSAHTVYLCVLCGSEIKQRLFPYTAWTDWIL